MNILIDEVINVAFAEASNTSKFNINDFGINNINKIEKLYWKKEDLATNTNKESIFENLCNKVTEGYRYIINWQRSIDSSNIVENEDIHLFSDLVNGRFMFSPSILGTIIDNTASSAEYIIISGIEKGLSTIYKVDFSEYEIVELLRGANISKEEISKIIEDKKKLAPNKKILVQMNFDESYINEVYSAVVSQEQDDALLLLVIDADADMNEVSQYLEKFIYTNKEYNLSFLLAFDSNTKLNNQTSNNFLHALKVASGYINLAQFTKKAEGITEPIRDNLGLIKDIKLLDYKELGKQVVRAIHYLKNLYPSEVTSRPIRLGIMGLAEVFIDYGITYESDEAKILSSNIIEFINGIVAICSVDKKLEEDIYFNCKDPFDKDSEQIINCSYLKNDIKFFYEKNINVFNGCYNNIVNNKASNNDYYLYNVASIIKAIKVLYTSLDINYDGRGDTSLYKILDLYLSGRFHRDPIISLVGNKDIAGIFGVSNSIYPLEWIYRLPNDSTEVVYNSRASQMIIDRIRANDILPSYYETIYDINPTEVLQVYKEWYNMSNSISTIKIDLSITKDFTLLASILNAVKNTNKVMVDISFNSTISDRYFNNVKPYKEIKMDATILKDTAVEQSYERPLILEGMTERADTPFGSIYVTTNMDNNEITECFIKLGKNGSDIQALIEAIARLISIGLQNGVSMDKYISTLDGIIGKEVWTYKNSQDGKEVEVYSVPDLISKMLKTAFVIKNK